MDGAVVALVNHDYLWAGGVEVIFLVVSAPLVFMGPVVPYLCCRYLSIGKFFGLLGRVVHDGFGRGRVAAYCAGCRWGLGFDPRARVAARGVIRVAGAVGSCDEVTRVDHRAEDAD